MMLSLRLLPIGLWLLVGCSPVTKDLEDGGPPDSGGVCLGEVDQAGACVCGPRATGELCDECLPGWSDPARACPQFADDFQRDDGALGPAWEVPNLGVPGAEIVDGRACGTTQSVGLLVAPIESRDFTVRFTFHAESQEGLEAAFAFAQNENLLPAFVAGCDGGFDGCLLQISEFGAEPLADRDSQLVAGVDATFELTVDGDQVSLRLTQTGLTPEVIAATLPAGFETLRLGFIVGRELLSCVDDFSLTIR
jgi:hypothetical protein